MHPECWAKKLAMRETRSMRYAPCSRHVHRYSVRKILWAADCTFRFTRSIPSMPTSSGPASAPP